MNSHHYTTKVEWTGNKGSGTFDYRSYSRNHNIIVEDKIVIEGSSDSSFRGDATRHNPEDLFVSSISACHMLWYLHLCAENGIIVLSYEDIAKGIMSMNKNGSGQFEEITLRPNILIAPDSDEDLAAKLHEQAHEMCFIANSCNFPIKHIPSIRK